MAHFTPRGTSRPSILSAKGNKFLEDIVRKSTVEKQEKDPETTKLSKFLFQEGDPPPSLTRLRANIDRLRTTIEHDEKSISPRKAAASPRTKPTPASARRPKDGKEAESASQPPDSSMRPQDVAVLQERYTELAKEAKEAMNANIRRTAKMQGKIDDLQEQLKQATARRHVDQPELRELNEQIQQGVEALQQRTARVLKEHELDLIRSFRTRLLDVQRELHLERSRQDEAALEWIEKAQSLTKKLDWAKEEALRLDGLNQMLTKENNRLRTQFKAQEGDRHHYVGQVVALKREVARLKQELQQQRATEQRPDDTQESAPLRETPQSVLLERSQSVRPSTSGDDGRLRDEVKRLRRLLESERRNLKKARESYVGVLAERTELQAFLRQCIGDVQEEIVQVRMATSTTPRKIMGVDAAEFTARDRSRALEMLLSKERVLALLYDRAFPSKYQMPPQHAYEEHAEQQEEVPESDDAFEE